MYDLLLLEGFTSLPIAKVPTLQLADQWSGLAPSRIEWFPFPILPITIRTVSNSMRLLLKRSPQIDAAFK